MNTQRIAACTIAAVAVLAAAFVHGAATPSASEPMPHVVVTAQRMSTEEKALFDLREQAAAAAQDAPRVVVSAKRMTPLQKAAFDVQQALHG